MTGQTTAPRGGTFLKTAIVLQTLALFFQASTAGLLLTSSRAYVMHDYGSKVMYGAAMLYVLATILAWRPGGGSARPVLYSTGFLLLASAQVVLGIAHVASLHVPLGVVMFALSTLALVRTLSPRPPLHPAAGAWTPGERSVQNSPGKPPIRASATASPSS